MNTKTSELDTPTSFVSSIVDYGQINAIWSFSRADSGESVGLWNVTDTHCAFTGMRRGKGNFGMAIYETTRAFAVASDLQVYATPNPTWLSDASTGVSYLAGSSGA